MSAAVIKLQNLILKYLILFPLIALFTLIILLVIIPKPEYPIASAKGHSSFIRPIHHLTKNFNSSQSERYWKFIQANEKVRERFLKKREAAINRLDDQPWPRLWMTSGRYVWQYFPPTYTCPYQLEKIGGIFDGGKWVCGIGLFEERKGEGCIIYSIGDGAEASFEAELLNRTNCQIFMYNRNPKSHQAVANNGEKLKFQNIGLATTIGQSNSQTLQKMMKRNGHNWIDFLKINDESLDGVLSFAKSFKGDPLPFGHLNIEIKVAGVNSIFGKVHRRDDIELEQSQFEMFYNLWSLLEEQGLRAVGWQNNLVDCATNTWSSRPSATDYTFINVIATESKLLRF